MEVRAPAARSGEAGFLLLEAVVAVALVAVCACAVLATVAAVTKATARSLPAAALSLTAQNILTDLRAATAYDPNGLASLAGKAAAFDATESTPDGSGRTVHLTVTVGAADAAGTYVCSVTARTSDAAAVTLQAGLTAEAPAPGSVVPASTPGPSPAASGGGRDPDPIPL